MPLSGQGIYLYPSSLGSDTGSLKNTALDSFFAFPVPIRVYTVFDNETCIQRSDGVAVVSIFDPFYLFLSVWCLSCKMHMQFYLAPELHVAHQYTQRWVLSLFFLLEYDIETRSHIKLFGLNIKIQLVSKSFISY